MNIQPVNCVPDSMNDRMAIIEDLRRRIGSPTRGCGVSRTNIATGVDALDAHPPGGGLARGAVHEFMGGGDDLRHGAAAARFAASILGGERGPVLWVCRVRDCFAPGLAWAGLHPDRLIYAETDDDAAVLAVAEEALRHRVLAGVVAESPCLTLQASRRLQLAAEASGVCLFVIRRWSGRGRPETTGTVAATRWTLTALASAPLGGVPGLGDPRWRVELTRCRGGATGAWAVEACDETGRLRLAPDLADRPAQAGAWRPAAG